MTPKTLSKIALTFFFLLTGCNSTSSEDSLTENEKAIVGTWSGTIGSAQIVMTFNADKTGKGVTTIDNKIYFVGEGVWKVSGNLCIITNTKCSMADSLGTLREGACPTGEASTDTTAIAIIGNKWTINSNGSNNADVIFTKQ